jgi:hypothetical protein
LFGVAEQEIEQDLQGLHKTSGGEEFAQRIEAESEERTGWTAISF